MENLIARFINAKLRGPSVKVAVGCVLSVTAGVSGAQNQTATPASGIDELQEVTIVGSRIKGAVATEALPVVVLGQELID
ncbi:MAG: hypothetical protein FJ154_05735, partial [Gammaproteobacteria bacterium]|nr:hypothetical protein [Gammaproteobacteria bacterium]